MRKCLFALLICLLLPAQAMANEREVYIALGDSLAAGQTPYSQIDAGYTDFIALQLQKKGKLAHFTKELTFPGYRVSDVIDTVKSEQAELLLQDATVITISAGANDLLPLIAHNPNQGTLNFSQLNANLALNNVREEMAQLLLLVRELAPKADVYVVGYYFPYVSVHQEQVGGAATALKLLNDILAQEAKRASMTFVDVYDSFEENRGKYLTNNNDVHPNQLGYLIMANAILRSYSEGDSLQLQASDLPAPNPKSFEQILQLREQIQSKTVTIHNVKAPLAIYV
ncbi:SGNH/GDSL hydrolase family protein [Solibacillus sp. MA9]|uniref:SGNH/GDSL hydrolase family protein n=1 Tax=Solibacillus palustris TaxID=2908203 RepID=A0ABS9UFV9_9BACL|nr:SGNH/GDSL hydrolase family protein [Solibacillus sp. MA9]MCH7323211.1 SGNH/GDSL hydrolase family protein [Solibacillus sp. MA9]